MSWTFLPRVRTGKGRTTSHFLDLPRKRLLTKSPIRYRARRNAMDCPIPPPIQTASSPFQKLWSICTLYEEPPSYCNLGYMLMGRTHTNTMPEGHRMQGGHAS